MNVYFSGIGGVGIGPLAEIARDAGHTILGSDLVEGLVTEELRQQGVTVNIGQDGTFLKASHEATPLDWFVYTAALPDDHPELVMAKQLGIRMGKRDEFLADFIEKHNLKLIAIAGTHGKTTTTGMAVWAFQQRGIPVSYSIGSTVSFGPSGKYDPESEYFIYECDEYDRNFLHFNPSISLITSVDYDHPDTFPTEKSYFDAFNEFISQSKLVICWNKDINLDSLGKYGIVHLIDQDKRDVSFIDLDGLHNRQNAFLVFTLLVDHLGAAGDEEAIVKILNAFPGTDRRFEKLADNIYSDYGHHPEEIAATLQMAHELSDDVVLVYQPHQNWRQYFIHEQYTNQFEFARKIYWTPTYLTRENSDYAILTPQELTTNITNKDSIVYTDLNDKLWEEIVAARDAGSLILFMGAGTIDAWVRSKL
ncbi:MAG: murC [Candidatus Saccharibacteria bacterium]|nr:murC [Candidatus Saccharibacteria bacterium]MDB5180518.1 murC [Candidatus Saccharibacteria bacterium]